MLAPSVDLDPRLGMVASKPTYPFSLKPDKLISSQDVMRCFRDHFEGTEFDQTVGLAAGPFGSPVRWGGPSTQTGGWERELGAYETQSSYVITARPFLPDVVGGRLWFSFANPHGSTYVPFYGSQESIPASYYTGKQSVYSRDSGFWAFSFITNWMQIKFNYMAQDVKVKQIENEDYEFAEAAKLEGRALQVLHGHGRDAARKLLEEWTNHNAQRVVDDWWAFGDLLIAKYADGYITTGEAQNQQTMPGYPEWWLEAAGYTQWPGDGWVPPYKKGDYIPPLTVPKKTSAAAEVVEYPGAWAGHQVLLACIMSSIVTLAACVVYNVSTASSRPNKGDYEHIM